MINKKYRILFVAPHRPNRSPGQRYRFEQYFDFLKNKNIDCELSYIIDENDDKILYENGEYFSKFLIAVNSYKKRKEEIKTIKNYDLVFVYREALLTGSTFFEKLLKKNNVPFVFDFDDAIWLLDTSEANRKFKWLKRPSKTAEIIGLSSMVFAGNEYLAAYAKQFNSSVAVIPSTIDTDLYIPLTDRAAKDRICIGWSGSITTIKHFEMALPALKIIKEKFGNRVEFKVMGDPDYMNNELQIKGIKWSHESEVDVLRSFDIGIMPLPDNEWAKGKCGLKALSYMALEIPAVASGVGVNSKIIQSGVNGYIADTVEDWVQALTVLIENESLRKTIGAAARKTVVDKYSIHANKEKYLNSFMELLRK